jgi:hypothetical protein
MEFEIIIAATLTTNNKTSIETATRLNDMIR